MLHNLTKGATPPYYTFIKSSILKFTNGILNFLFHVFKCPSMKNGVAYLNKQTSIENLNLDGAVIICCVAVACRVPEKRACKKEPSGEQEGREEIG